jgi:hypothetical protein
MSLRDVLMPRLMLRLDQRREPRMFADKKVIVRWGSDGVQVGVATVIDWSMHGLRLKHDLNLQSDDVVMVMTPEADLKAQVVWCSTSPVGRESGLRLLDPTDPNGFMRSRAGVRR